MAKLSILIPARNEMFLAKTIEDIVENIEEDTEVIAVLDGGWAEPGIRIHSQVNVVYLPESIGQRAATNLAAKISTAKYLMKVDAHCKFDKGFDRKMIEKMEDNFTMVPIMHNLWAFDWVCPDGHRRYQSPSGPCKICHKATTREITWRIDTKKDETARGQWKRDRSPSSTSYSFDSEPHFQYFKDYTKRPEYVGDLTETMSIQGSCFLVTREKYWELNLCDESWGSWGSQGIEVACKTWLSGGRVVVNHNTWYAHLFRTQGDDFGFPYEQNGDQVQGAKKIARDLFYNNKWRKQVRNLSWLLEKFWPIPGWSNQELAEVKKNDIIF